MSDEDAKKLPTTADAPRLDGFEGYEDAVEGGEEQTSGRVIQGELVKFTNEATWTCNGEELSSELELVVIDIGRIVQRWQDSMPVETIVLAPGQKFPDIGKLNASVPREEWEEGPDGKPRGPWQTQHVAYMLNPADMARFSWPTGTIGGAIAVRDIVDKVKWMRRFRGQNVYPVVALSDVFMNTRFGGRQRPHLEVKRWVTLGDSGPPLPATDMPKLPDQRAREVKPPTRQEELGDSIPF